MKTTLIKEFGWIAYFKDYVQMIRSETFDEYYISTTNLEIATANRYNKRMIGIHKTTDNNYIVAVAIAPLNDENSNNRTGSRVVNSRIISYVENDQSKVSGVTYVPSSYLHLLVNDEYTYNILSGPINRDDLIKAVSFLDSAEKKYIAKQITSAYVNRRLQLSI